MLKDHFSPVIATKVEEELKCIETLYQEMMRLSTKGKAEESKKLWVEVLNSLNQIVVYGEAEKHNNTAIKTYNAILEEEARRNKLALGQ